MSLKTCLTSGISSVIGRFLSTSAIEEINVLLGSNGRLLGKEGLSGVYGEEVINPSTFNKGNVTDYKPPVRDPLGNPTAAYAWKQLPRK